MDNTGEDDRAREEADRKQQELTKKTGKDKKGRKERKLQKSGKGMKRQKGIGKREEKPEKDRKKQERMEKRVKAENTEYTKRQETEWPYLLRLITRIKSTMSKIPSKCPISAFLLPNVSMSLTFSLFYKKKPAIYS